MPQQGSQNRRPPKRTVNGILLLDKPSGITSNRALQIAKRIYNARKAGHTGSLDPLASGMLPLCFGQATKVSGWLLDSDKEYVVEALFGIKTDTADADGQVIETCEKSSVSRDELEAALAEHRGEFDQIPPMYSALKKDGRRLYELAREGVVVERPPRQVSVYEFEVVHFDPVRPVLKVRCSKGTYVRSLIETLADQMNTLGHVAALRRTGVGCFAGAEMVTMEQLEALSENEEGLDGLLLPPDSALAAFPEVRLIASEALYLRNGHAVGHVAPEIEGVVRIYDENGEFIGLGEIQPDGRVAPKRLFTGAPENPK